MSSLSEITSFNLDTSQPPRGMCYRSVQPPLVLTLSRLRGSSLSFSVCCACEWLACERV